jgi:hypothetical protein
MGKHPTFASTTTHLKNGRWWGLAPAGEYVFTIYNDQGTGGFVVFARERAEDDPLGWGPMIWHVLDTPASDDDDFHGIFITRLSEFGASDIRPCLWIANGNRVDYFWLETDGSPIQRAGDITLAPSGNITSGDIDGDMPQVSKQLRMISGWVENFAGSGHSLQFLAALDGASYATVAAAITADGYFERFWTQDSSDVARVINIQMNWTGSDNLTSQNGPYARDVVVHLVALPDTTREWTFLFDVEDEQSKTAKKIRSELEGYVGDLKKYTLPDKDTFNGVMGKPRMLRADEISALTPRNQEPPHYVIAAPVREMSGS